MPNSAPEWSGHIQKLLRKLRVSQSGLAALVGVSPATITRWMKGTHEPTSASYVAMGNLAGSPDGLYFWERAGVDPAHLPATNVGVTLSSHHVDLKNFHLVPGHKVNPAILADHSTAVLLPLLNITAYGHRVPPGPHVTLSQAKVEDLLVAPLGWCPHPANMLSMHVAGDSMVPIIPPDAIISVDTAVTAREQLDKKLAVFSHRDLGFKVARLQRLPSSDILVSANHEYLPVDVSDASRWKVLGQVMWWISRDALPHQRENSIQP